MTEARSFQVPARLSMRTILKIWKNRRPRNVDAANISLVVPTSITINVAIIMTKSAMIPYIYMYITWTSMAVSMSASDARVIFVRCDIIICAEPGPEPQCFIEV